MFNMTPVAWIIEGYDGFGHYFKDVIRTEPKIDSWSSITPLYTAPRELSDEVIKELIDCLQEAVDGMGGAYAIWSPKAKAILKKAREK